MTAYDIARSEGLRYVYVGNVHDVARQSTFCHQCGHLLIEREGYRLGNYTIDSDGRCQNCCAQIPGRFAAQPGDWGARRQPLHIEQYAVIATDEAIPTAERRATFHEASTPTVIAMEEVIVTSTNSAPTTTPAGPIASPRPLKLGSLTAEQRSLVLKLAAAGISQTVTRQAMKLPEEVVGSFSQSIVMGVFVTLKRGEVLRGCCGVLGKPMALGPAISSAATRTATEDHRFTPISACELPYLNLDVTLLGPFQRLEARGSKRAAEIQVGKHGLMIQQGDKSGLLLPSVATERGWGAERFLQAVCAKAGLPPAAWESDDSSLMIFEGETFSRPLSEELPLNLPTARPAATDVRASVGLCANRWTKYRGDGHGRDTFLRDFSPT